MTSYTDWLIAIAKSKDFGNALAHMAAAFPHDPGAELETFTDDRKCDPEAWWAVVPARPAMIGVIDALSEGVDYTDERLAYLRDRGLTSEQWEMAKDVIIAAHYPRIVDVQIHADPQALNKLAAAHGYTILEPEDA